MYSVLQVADAILKIAKARGMALTPLQVMKLVYIAHGFYLAMRDGDLFHERIEAWKYGPVIPDLYQATKKFGRNPIPLDLVDDGDSGVTEEDADFLRDVFDKYGHLDGIALSSLTHKQGTPWQQVYDGYFGTEIPDTLIRSHYEKIVNGQRPAAAAGNVVLVHTVCQQQCLDFRSHHSVNGFRLPFLGEVHNHFHIFPRNAH